jgi:hypothetical protein
MATKKKPSTDAQLIAKAKVNTPWLIPLLTDPEHGKTYLDWARDAEAGKAPTSQQVLAATYNWDITQTWTANQAKLFNLSLTNPGEYKSQLAESTAAIDSAIKKSGLPVDNTKRQELIDNIFLKGWKSTDPRIAELVGGTYDVTKVTSGTAQNLTDQMKGLARNYMIPLDQSTLNSWGQAISKGTSTIEDMTKYLKGQAAGLYPFMSGVIDSVTPETYFSPLKSLIQTNLEVNPAAIDFNDPSGKWMNLAYYKDPKTGANVARSNSEAIKEMRTNPIYGYDTTQGAIDSAYALGSQIRALTGHGA